MGVAYMDAYYTWGRNALTRGVPKSYQGIYFPLQYQLFELYAWVVFHLKVEFFTIFKVSNLLFDLGSFALLVLFLKRQRSNPAYALVYWLHPWFLAVFSLGYVDFQFSFFVLLCIWFLQSETTKDYLLAGLPLGAAFLMKPQAQVLIVATFAFCVFRYLRTKNVRPFAMLAGPVFIFLGYEAWFIRALHMRPRYLGAAVLPSSYLNVTNVMPSLTAQMTNIWCPIAYFLKAPGETLTSVSDQLRVLPFVSAKYLAASAVVIFLVLHVFRVERNITASISDSFLIIFGFATLLVPFVMTSAHENHLFLGTVLMVPFLARPLPLSFQLSAQVLLVVQFLNIYSYYGTHPAGLAVFLQRTRSDQSAILYSLISVVCFVLIAWPLWSGLAQPETARDES
jgi:hypothetical protein